VFKNSRKRRTLGVAVALAAAVAAVGAYAFTAGITVPAISAGYGNNTVSPYTVNSVDETDHDADGSHVIGVKFTLDAAASDVLVSLVAAPTGGDDWVDCGPTASNQATCVFDGSHGSGPVLATDDTKLSVIAVSQGQATVPPSP
jgi:putative alpha-1,2-mannosidase